MFALGVTLGETLADVSWIRSIAAISKKRPKCADVFIVVDDPRTQNRHDRQPHHVQDKRSELGRDHAFFDEHAARCRRGAPLHVDGDGFEERRDLKCSMRVQAIQPRSRDVGIGCAVMV